MKPSSFWGRLCALACAVALLSGCALSRSERQEQPQLEDGGSGHEGHEPGGDGDLDSGLHPTPGRDGGGGPDSGDRDAGPAPGTGDVPDAGGGGEDTDASAFPDGLVCSALPFDPPVLRGYPDNPIEHRFDEGSFDVAVNWRGRMFVRAIGLTPGARYAVVLTGPSVDLALFANDDVFGVATCQASSSPLSGPAICVATATQSTLDLTIHTEFGQATPIELNVLPVDMPEGTVAAPVEVAEDDLPLPIAASPSPPSFYEITGLTPGTHYVVTARSSTGARVGATTYEVDEPAAPPADMQHAANGAIGTPVGTTLRVAVLAMPPAGTVTIDIAPASRASQGTKLAPQQIAATDLPYAGEVGWAYHQSTTTRDPAGESFYAITGLAPGNYAISVHGAPGAQLTVYDDDATFSTSHCWSGMPDAEDQTCASRIAGSTLHAKVTNPGGDGYPITLDLEAAPFVSAGTPEAPLTLASSELPASGEAQVSEPSYYEISGLTPGQRYSLELSELSGPIFLSVRDSDNATDLSSGFVTGDSRQTEVVSQGTSVYVQIAVYAPRGAQTLGVDYVLDLAPVEDTPDGPPIALDCNDGYFETQLGTIETNHDWLVELDPSLTYIIEARPETQVSLLVESLSNEPLCNAFGTEEHPARCFVKSLEGTVLVHVGESAVGEPIDLIVRRLHVGSEGSATAPIEIAETPHRGRVASGGASFYRLTGLTAGQTYRLRVGSSQENVVVQRLDSDNPSFEHTVYPGTPLDLLFTASSSSTRLKLTLTQPSDWISDVRIDLSPE